MSSSPILANAAAADAMLQQWKRAEGSPEWVLILYACLGVGGAAVLWAVFLRRKKRKRKRHSLAKTAQPSLPPVEPEAKASEGRSRQRRRRRRREHRRRNPTLAQTGGLPPLQER